MRRRRNQSPLILVVAILALVVIMIALQKPKWASSAEQAREVVDEFYAYEQEGEFSSSWKLFHSKMKEKFSKGFYIQDRAHVFMNHFGVETFTYNLGDVDEIENWKLSKDTATFPKAYRIAVEQVYKGKYGNFVIIQEVFVVKEKDDWKVLWDYKK
jgi:hypothetical protein